MNELKLRGYWTMRGDLIWGDEQDDDAPMVKVSFHNECARLTETQKVEILQKLAESLTPKH